MSGSALDARPARASGAIAAVVAVFLAVAVGWATGRTAATAVAVVAGFLVAAGASAVESSSRRRQAVGSVLATAGAAVLFGLFVRGLGGAAGWIRFVLWLGVAFVLVDATVGVGRPRESALATLAGENGRALAVGAAVLGLLHVVIASRVVGAVLDALFFASTATALAGFVTLQVLAVLVVLSIPGAVETLAGWIEPGDSGTSDAFERLREVGVRPGDLPRAALALIGLQAVVALVPAAHRLFGDFFGAFAPVLTSGVLHAVLGVALAVTLAVRLADALRGWAVAWFGAVPARTAALQAGGLVSVLVTAVVTLLLGLLPGGLVGTLLEPVVVDALEPVLTDLVEFLVPDRLAAVGLPAAVLAFLGVGLVTVLAALAAAPLLASRGLLPERAPGFAAGSALLLLGVLGAATAGLQPLLVFAGVAGAVFVWDVGAHASGLGRDLGRTADARRAEFVHLTGTALVLSGAVALAAVANAVVVPALAPASAGPAAVSLVLVLVAVLAFVGAVRLDRGRPKA